MDFIERKWRNDLELQLQQIQTLFEEKERELLNRLDCYQNQVSHLDGELQRSQVFSLSIQDRPSCLDTKYPPATAESAMQTEASYDLWQKGRFLIPELHECPTKPHFAYIQETAEILKSMDSLFSDAYRTEIQQFRQLVDNFETIPEPNVISPAPLTTYLDRPVSSQIRVSESRSSLKAFRGPLLVLTIMGLFISIIIIHFVPELWLWPTSIIEDYAIPQ